MNGVNRKSRDLKIELEPALWVLLERARAITAEKARRGGRREKLSTSRAASLILTEALGRAARDIQHEYEALEYERTVGQLQPLLAAQDCEILGLPTEGAGPKRVR
jgi:hypothetical protein